MTHFSWFKFLTSNLFLDRKSLGKSVFQNYSLRFADEDKKNISLKKKKQKKKIRNDVLQADTNTISFKFFIIICFF